MTAPAFPDPDPQPPMLVRRGHEGWDQEYEFRVEVYADHLVWLYDIEGGRGGPLFEPERVRQPMQEFLERGPPWRWSRFAAEQLRAEFPQQAVEHYWRAALEQLERAVHDLGHDSGSWYAHLDTVAQILCRVAGDRADWRARLAELRRLDPAPPTLSARLRELEERYGACAENG